MVTNPSKKFIFILIRMAEWTSGTSSKIYSRKMLSDSNSFVLYLRVNYTKERIYFACNDRDKRLTAKLGFL